MAYQLVQRLGRGGMGVVDLATDPSGRTVAIKRLTLHGSAREMHQARQRIRREAEALRLLDHPHIVRLLDVHDNEAGDEIVLVMPYLSGGTLADRVHTGGPLPPDEVDHLRRTLLAALASAHRAGIVHRDIKPANVLFDEGGSAYLADFGIASLQDATSGLTVTGMMLGTPQFMAPEQARGERATAASDVFALGATLAYAATGTPPYGHGDPSVLIQRAARGQVAPLPRELPRELRKPLEAMLEQSPRRRPTAAAAAGGPAGTAVFAPPARRPDRRIVAGGAAAAVLLVVVAVTGLVVSRRGSTGEAGPPVAPTTVAAPTTAPCVPLPYQPCGKPVAAFTDGSACIADHADYDADAANGCEAAPDVVDGSSFSRSLEANLVPTADVDRYPFRVADELSVFCDGTVVVTLTAPAGSAMHVEVLQGDVVQGSATSTDLTPGRVTLREPSCFNDDSTDLVARVSWSGPRRTEARYTLEHSGSF